MKWDIFIAHAGPDTQIAEALFDAIGARARVFLDSRRLKAGDRWDTELPAAQKESAMTVVVITTNTDAAFYQQEEIAQAIACSREPASCHRVIPLSVNLTEESRANVPYGLRRIHSITCTNGDMTNAANQIVDQVQSSLPNPIPEPRFSTRQIKLIAFDLDGTLIRGRKFKYSWKAIWDHLHLDKSLHQSWMKKYVHLIENAADEHLRQFHYAEWCEKVASQFRSAGLHKKHFAEIAIRLHVTKNFRQVIPTLRAEGFKLAIISGGVDALMLSLIPDAADLFDFVSINQFNFNADGLFESCTPVKNDFRGKALYLQEISNSLGISVSDTCYVGEGINDTHAVKLAGLSIAYPPNSDSSTIYSDHVIEKDDMREILKHVMPTSPLPTNRP